MGYSVKALVRSIAANDVTMTAATFRDVSEYKLTEEPPQSSREQLREFAAGLEQVREDERKRVAREIHDELGQALIHTGARPVRVNVTSRTGRVRITIADDGKGLGRPQISDRKSFGIARMRERVQGIGGEFNIFSVPGWGTRLEISVPLK